MLSLKKTLTPFQTSLCGSRNTFAVPGRDPISFEIAFMALLSLLRHHEEATGLLRHFPQDLGILSTRS